MTDDCIAHRHSSLTVSLLSDNNELVKCLEDLREKRETLNKAVRIIGKHPADCCGALRHAACAEAGG